MGENAPSHFETVVVVEEIDGTVYRTPYDQEFTAEIHKRIPQNEHRWQQSVGTRHKGWWVAHRAKPIMEQLIEEFFGIGSNKGAHKFLGVSESLPAQAIAAVYQIRRSLAIDEAAAFKLDRAIETIERSGRPLAPPYDEQGESSGQASLLTIPTHPLSLPPIATRVARMTRETLEAVFTNLDWLTLQVTKLRRNLYGDHEQCEDLDFDEGGSRDE